MNLLAHIIHNLMTGQEVTGPAKLPPPEQAALADLKSLLSRSPQELADTLAQEQQGIDWTKGTSLASHNQT